MASVLEQVARASHGRLLALLAARTGDIAAAEDALAEAYLAPRPTPKRGSSPWRATASATA